MIDHTIMTELPFRRNVSIILFNHDKKLLLGERYHRTGIWQFPQGGVEKDDTEEQTVIKEIYEELGLPQKTVTIVTKLKSTNCYTWQVPPVHWQGIYQGQDQSFWLVELTDKNAKFKLESNIEGNYKPEFSRVDWFTIEQVPSVVEPIRLEGYQKALNEVKSILKIY